MEYQTRTTWKNQLGNERIDPLRIYRPESIAEVQAIVRLARESGVTVRAVGSGHSWSDVALTEGFLLRPDGMTRVPAPEPDFVRPDWAARRLVRAEAGTRVKELNAWLDANGMGLTNMGGYDHQTIAGVTSTSTHGSGIEFGPLNDALRSLDVVVGDGSVQRIEPSDGPTDRAASRPTTAQRACSCRTTTSSTPSASGSAAWGSSARRCSRCETASACARCASCIRGRRSRPTCRQATCSNATSTTRWPSAPTTTATPTRAS